MRVLTSWQGDQAVKKVWIRLSLLLLIFVVLMYPRLTQSQSAYYENEVAVLLYHHVDETARSNVTITPELFHDQLKYLQDMNYHFITLEQMESFLNGGPVPDNAVFVTFDDGYQSFYTKAFPILEELGIPAVNFAITGDLEHPNSGNVPSMTREDIAAMTAKSANVEVQCHSDSLHRKDKDGKPYLLNRLKKQDGAESAEDYRKRVVDDTVSCRQKLEQLDGRKHRHYAYPFGMYDQESINLLREAGIQYGYTTVSEIALPDTDPMLIPRINAGAPYVSPSELHNLIVNKKIIELPDDQLVPLGQIINRMGGKITNGPDHSIELHFGSAVWTLKSGERIARSGSGETVELKAPLQFRNKKNYIRLDDLQNILKYRIVYYPNKKFYHIRHTPDRNPQS